MTETPDPAPTAEPAPEPEPAVDAVLIVDTDEIHDDLTLAQRPRVQDSP